MAHRPVANRPWPNAHGTLPIATRAEGSDSDESRSVIQWHLTSRYNNNKAHHHDWESIHLTLPPPLAPGLSEGKGYP